MYNEFKTGITEAFCAKGKLDCPPTDPENRGVVREEEEEQVRTDILEKPAKMTAEEKKTTSEKKSSCIPSLRDPIKMFYPGKQKMLIILELAGSIDDDNIRIEISPCRKKITQYIQIPEVRFSANALIGGIGTAGREDHDIMLLQAFLDDQTALNADLMDTNEEYWEAVQEVELDFQCQPYFVGQNGREIDQFYIAEDDKGYGWAFFWLLNKDKKSTNPKRRTGCRVKAGSKL